MESLYQMADDARLYAFAASRELVAAEVATLSAEVAMFIRGWQSHREKVTAAHEIREGRFLLIGIDETQTALSGCSIDGLVRNIRGLESRLGVTFVGGDAVYYRDAGAVLRTTRSGFRELARAGKIGPETSVFDLTIVRIGDFRDGRLEVPLRESWHPKLVLSE